MQYQQTLGSYKSSELAISVPLNYHGELKRPWQCDDSLFMVDLAHKVLICSQDSTFLSAQMGLLQQTFSLQTSFNEGMTLFLLREWRADICLIDIDHSTPTLIPSIRQIDGFEHAIIMAFSRDDSGLRELYAFENGADDFILMPFIESTLVYRIKTRARRLPSQPHFVPSNETRQMSSTARSVVQFGPLQIYPHDYIVKNSSKMIETTPTQFRLLVALIENQDQLLSRQWLQQKVWNGNQISPRSIDAQISKLKRLLPFLEQSLRNVYGQGYVLTSPQQDAA